MPRRVRTAVLLAFLCHGFFILTGRYRLSYDAYTHMLFANHYAENWFSLWEPRWYTGFSVVSYPPLTHQLIALFIPLLGFDKAFALILWVVTSLYPLGVYAFSRIFTGRTSASYAALASAVLLPIYVTAHIFGQLPFLTGTLVALFAAASLDRYLRDGGLHNFALTVSLYTTAMAMHHATLMVHPFLILAVLVNYFFGNSEKFRLKHFLLRMVGFVLVTSLTSLIVIYPFWQWGAGQTVQTPIDHLSRHNFFRDPLALAIFFFPLYGPFVVLIPFLFRKWHPRFTGLLISFTILFLLGLGGTTPLPRLLFGSAWEWLTYDRFAVWACLTLTPFFGLLLIQWKKKQRLRSKPASVWPRKNPVSALTFSFLTLTALAAWFTPLVFPLQPKPVNMQPIVDFLNTSDHSRWRYVTFGFGDQFAYLNLLTKANTLDGSYHTARTLPELRNSGLGQIDTAYWALNGMQALVPILQKSGERGVRWGFVNPGTVQTIHMGTINIRQSPFVPILDKLGWKKITTLDNGVWVYENQDAEIPPSAQVPLAPLASFAWGVFPLLAFVTATSLGTLRLFPVKAEWVLRQIYAFVVSLLPLSLCFWLYQNIGEFSHPRVYLTYDNALFFLSDALAIVAVVLWLAAKIANWTHVRMTKYRGIFERDRPLILLFAFSLLITLSILWSQDWRTSLYISLHFWLIFLLILSLHDWHEAWTAVIYGLCGALSIELITGFAGFALQSTAFLGPWNMNWPGILDPSMRGASVVELANGVRLLRAYGSLPHPNILGGFAFLTLLGPASLFLTGRKPNYLALLPLTLGVILIGLTFSRSAWLALIAFIVVIILKSKTIGREKFLILISTIGLTIFLTLCPLRDFVFTRISNATIATEQISTVGRSWLTQQALDMIRRHPLSGVGIGSFVITLSNEAPRGAPVEPVHNLLLLGTSEVGILGLFLILGLFISITWSVFRSKSPGAILAGASLAGFGVIALFDHYLLTIAPGRMMLGLALGLWTGQVAHEA